VRCCLVIKEKLTSKRNVITVVLIVVVLPTCVPTWAEDLDTVDNDRIYTTQEDRRGAGFQQISSTGISLSLLAQLEFEHQSSKYFGSSRYIKERDLSKALQFGLEIDSSNSIHVHSVVYQWSS
jgi:hypothetical protein